LITETYVKLFDPDLINIPQKQFLPSWFIPADDFPEIPESHSVPVPLTQETEDQSGSSVKLSITA
jgi:hypothetical protein